MGTLALCLLLAWSGVAPAVAASVSGSLAIAITADVLTADDDVTVLTVDGTTIPLEAR